MTPRLKIGILFTRTVGRTSEIREAKIFKNWIFPRPKTRPAMYRAHKEIIHT